MEYFSKGCDEELEMEPRPERAREFTLPLRMRSPRARRQRERLVRFKETLNRERDRIEGNTKGSEPSEVGVEENGKQEMNLPPLLAAHLGRSEDGQPQRPSLTCVYGGRQSLINTRGSLPPNDGLKMPSHVGSYDGKGDPDNFLHLFKGVIRMQKWLMPVACHMFTYTLKDSARICQQKRFIKTHLAFHSIKQREGESVRAFATRYTDDTLQILGLHEDQRIFSFVHGLKARNLVEHLSIDLPSTYKGLMEKTYTWIEAREVATNGALNYRRDNFKSLSKSLREIIAKEKVAKTFQQPLRLPGSKWSRDKTKYYHFHKDHGHDTNQCRELKHQIAKAVKSGQLAHLVKGIKKKKEKVFDTQLGEWKEEKKKAKPIETHVLMISRRSCNPRKRHVEEDYNEVGEITFPLVTKDKSSADPVIIKAYVSFRVDSKTPLIGFSGEYSWPLGELPLEITIGEGLLIVTKTLNFVINAGATYQRLIDKVFRCQVGRNMEVNADKMVIKSDSEKEMLADIKETLERLRVINLKLNPKKCSFRVEEGRFSGRLITTQGIKADPSKVKAISDLQPPKTVSEMQSLNKKLAAINRFLSKGADEMLSFMGTLKNCTSGNMIQWTTDTDEAFRRMKELLEALPTMTAPVNGETLIIYLTAFEESISAVFMAERGKNQVHVYFISRTLHGVELEYLKLEKLILALVYAARKLRRYFQAHPIQKEKESQKEEAKRKRARIKEKSIEIVHSISFKLYALEQGLSQSTRRKRYTYALRTITSSTRRRKVPGSGHRLLHKMGRSKAANFNDREAHGKIHVGIHKYSKPSHQSITPQANRHVEVTNRDVIKGMERRLGKTHQGWVDELPQVLWAHRTTLKSSNGETPFSLIYGSKAVIQIEISVETRRIQDFDPKENEKRYREDLDILEQISGITSIKEAHYSKN
ncbi:reverse transcriptase domain-containing protein [Tanacetum coccineum]